MFFCFFFVFEVNKIRLNQFECFLLYAVFEISNISILQYRGGEAISMIKKSIEIGYRHFDTAFLYNNELEVGEGIRAKIADGTVTRSEIFISTKVKLLVTSIEMRFKENNSMICLLFHIFIRCGQHVMHRRWLSLRAEIR